MNEQRALADDLACRGITSPRGPAQPAGAPTATGRPTDRPARTDWDDERRDTEREYATRASDQVTAAALSDDGAGDDGGDVARTFARAVRHATEPTSGEGGELAALRAALHAYVARRRAGGVPPERALVGVKTAVARGALVACYPNESWRESAARTGAAALTERAVRWAIEAYFACGGPQVADDPARAGVSPAPPPR